MSERSSTLTAQLRRGKGSATARRMRRTGVMPAVLIGADGESRPIQLDAHGFELMLHRHSSEHMLLDLDVEGIGPRKVLLQEVQRDPLDGKAMHADFLEVSATKKLRLSVPLEFAGDPVGVTEGGQLEYLLRSVEIECLPADIVERIDVDVSGLRLNTTLLVRDLQLSPGVTVLTAPGVAVAAVVVPRKEAEPEAEAAEAAEGEAPAEGEAAAEGKKESDSKES